MSHSIGHGPDDWGTATDNESDADVANDSDDSGDSQVQDYLPAPLTSNTLLVLNTSAPSAPKSCHGGSLLGRPKRTGY